MSGDFSESVVEAPALAWLDGLSYTELHSPETAPDAPTAERFMDMMVLPW